MTRPVLPVLPRATHPGDGIGLDPVHHSVDGIERDVDGDGVRGEAKRIEMLNTGTGIPDRRPTNVASTAVYDEDPLFDYRSR